LIWEIEDKEGCLSLKITGPQAILKLSQKYGFSMACFLPSVFNLPRWRVKSQVLLKHKKYFLDIDESSLLNATYLNFSHYVPEDMLLIRELLEKKFDDWSLSNNEKFLKLHSDYYVFPDFKIVHNKTGKALFIETFHPWHKSQLLKRLKYLKKHNEEDLIVLLNKKCLGKDFDKNLMDSLDKVIVYTNIPNQKKLKELIQKLK
jgi:predicted nuclease of restriction endonuclease-like RecB superfamily